MEPFTGQRSGRYRPKVVTRAPRRIPDERFDALFAQLGSHRDRALVAFWVSTGARASELLGATVADADPGQQLITVMRKGTRVLQPLPAAPDAFVWLRLYQAQLSELVPAGRDEPLWRTLRRPFRALSYDAARAMFTRANAALGSNWSLHDLRHTAAYRMARDPQMPLTDVQWVLGHAHLSTTQRYLNPVTEDVITGVLAFHARRRDGGPAAPPAPGYRAESLQHPVRREHIVTAVSSQQVITAPAMGRVAGTGLVKTTGAQLLTAFPPRPVALIVAGDARQADPLVLTRVLATPFTLDNPVSQQTRRLGVLAVLTWLQTHPGDSWQQRWQASGAEDQADWRDLITDRRLAARARTATGTQLPHLGPGLLVLICADVIRPSLGWLLRFAPARRGLAAEMARTRDRTAFAVLAGLCTQGRVGCGAGSGPDPGRGDPGRQGRHHRRGPGRGLRGASAVATGISAEGRADSPLFYQLLRSLGGLGDDAPAAMEMFSGRGQPTCEQLIDRYKIACRPVRDVLVDYLRERQPSVDFSSLQRFAYLLGKLFWADLEAHHPGIDSLNLPRDVAAAWKQRVMTRTRTTTSPAGEQVRLTAARLDGRSVLSAVRAFYLDIAEWADDDPGGWAPWACTVRSAPATSPKGSVRRKSRMDQRTRERLPVLPALVILGGGRTGPRRRDARRSRTHPARCAVHHRGPDAAPSGHGPETTGRLGRAPGQRKTPRSHLRRAPWVLDVGDGRGAPPHRHPHRGTDRTVASQPDPVPAAGRPGNWSRCCRSSRPRPTPNGC